MNKEQRIIILSTISVLLASIFRNHFPKSEAFGLFLYVLSMLLVLLMIYSWAIHINNQIVQVQLRRYMGILSMLMMLWIFLRYTRYYLFDDHLFVARHFWYMYYIPMIFIPLNSFLFSLHFGRSIDWIKPRKYQILNVIASGFLFMVLFNDKLQLIFIFEDINNYNQYEYGRLYYLILLFMVVLIVSMLVNLIRKAFVKPLSIHVFIPFIVLGLGLIYIYLYIFVRVHWFFDVIDLTLMMNYINMMFWISVIHADLIPINQNHKQYFEEANFKALIMNEDKEILLKNKNSHELTDKMKDEIIQQGHTFISEYIVLNSEKIKQNYIVWEEDHENIQKSFDRKRELQSELLDELSILRLDLDIQKKAYSLILKNEMYDAALKQVEAEIANIHHYIKKQDLSKVTLWGIILKRKLNLILISEEAHKLSHEELLLSMDEVLSLLNQTSQTITFDYHINKELSTTTIYEIFHEITKLLMHSLDIDKTVKIDVSLMKNQNIKIQVNQNEVLVNA